MERSHATRGLPVVAPSNVIIMNQPASRKNAFIDIGTNSARLLLVELRSDGSYTILSERKEAIRLGDGMFDGFQLQPQAMERTVMVCKKFVEMAHSKGAEEIIAVATAATRESHNRNKFLARLKEEAGLSVRVVPGVEEARLIYLGVVSDLNLGSRCALFIDIGGGSTEVIIGDQRDYSFLDSLELGAIRLSKLFLGVDKGPVKKKKYEVLKSYIHDTAIRTIQNIQKEWGGKIDLVVGSSGTIENLADVAIQKQFQRRRLPEDVLTREQLEDAIKVLCEASLEERRKIPGINENRADIIIGGAAILDVLMESLEIDQIQISDRGLRDGLLIDYLNRLDETDQEKWSSFREESVLRLGRSLRFDEGHSRRVASLALQLFDSAAKLGMHDLGPWERELLEYAALLHDIGISLSYDDHQMHSYYFIRNANLLGFNQEEIDIMAATARFHRKGSPRKKNPEFAKLEPDSQEIVRVLCVFLSIAESLDRSHIGLVNQAKFLAGKVGQVRLQLHASKESPLEVWGVEYHEKVFQKVFGQQIAVELVIQERGDVNDPSKDKVPTSQLKID
jgi:exopolyphosphatase/guanosine-5'-triphosphate,3'-diphosphate pyrophosphatase